MKKSKFDEVFCEPMSCSNGAYLISGEYTREEAAKAFSDYVDEEVSPEALARDRVRFGFPPDSVEDGQDLGACWYTGASGKGSKGVWMIG